ncbi:putative ribonuclease H-like domain-containing protein [Tanacetum coccineum]
MEDKSIEDANARCNDRQEFSRSISRGLGTGLPHTRTSGFSNRSSTLVMNLLKNRYRYQGIDDLSDQLQGSSVYSDDQPKVRLSKLRVREERHLEDCLQNSDMDIYEFHVMAVWNKARLAAQGYAQEEGIDYDEVFAPISKIKAIMLFLAYASFKDFMVYQMDIKSAFLYDKIEEEVYVYQPPGFEDPDFLNRVYKVEKDLYGLHQAPRAWYETLSTYLLDNGFQRGKIDKTLFIKRVKGNILLVQVYVNGIIFGSTKKSLCTEFEKIMHKKFQMSFMGELTFFLGLQVKQREDRIFSVKTNSEDVDEHLYRFMIRSLMYLTCLRPDSMFAVCICARFQVNPKSSHLYAVKRIFRYLKGCRLISWQCKKQTVVANSTTEAEYIAASNCCG